MNDGHDNLNFSVSDLETFGSLITSDASENLEKVRALTAEIIDAETVGDEVRVKDLVRQLSEYITSTQN